MEVWWSRDFCCWSKSLFQSLDPCDEVENFVTLYTNWLSTKLFQQYVLQLSSAITRLYPFSHQNTFFTSTNAIFNIITYTHPFCTCNQTPQPPLKVGIQGNNLYIFLWYPKSKFKKIFFFKILDLKKSVCLKKWRLNLKQKIKPYFCNTHF